MAALSAVAALLMAGCADTGTPDSSADPATTGWVGERADGGTPSDGGTVSYATYRGVSSLDPAARQDGGATGGTEMAAIYDLLMRYDTEAGEYVPQLAESLRADDADTRWTLTLRDGPEFSDGTPVDADAVAWSIARYVEKKGTHAQVWQASVDATTVLDPRTVQFTLSRPWAEFPALLASGPGMIVAPSSVHGDDFTPVGAGPFTVAEFNPQNALVLRARKDYWGGAPHLDTLRFPAIVEEQGKIDTLKAGGVQLAYVKNAETVHSAIASGLSGWSYTANMSGVALINSRPDRAGADERVRKAIVAAINPDTYNNRVLGGFGDPGSAMFPEGSEWFSGTQRSAFDPDEARRLLAAAKADGYDGTLVYAGQNEANGRKSALAFQAMLESVGFTVELALANNINDLVKRMYATHDYDVGYSGFNVPDDAPFVRLYGNLYSDSPANPMGYENADMDRLLLEVQTARNEQDKRAALGRVQDLVDRTAPFATIGSSRSFIAMSDSVHNVTPSRDGIMLFGDAWVEQS
ncbi:ABC transporter substrate-binding protein (plasmid) [Tomitella fengzijianii]|uniref:ABC transporter substrate-binding protein n=1 Tax=Tomitella fengzijianii TaxID=2597660 RepID=A0A516X900_9ACTN|nr:ABC transporter substrate-binding protein [Tomitella fengzijianii]QDQ99512.1 ABC transporter substrate-binding protein [Tomitella fengzijianii]